MHAYACTLNRVTFASLCSSCCHAAPPAWLVCKHGNLLLTVLQAAIKTKAPTYPGSPEWALSLAHGHLPLVLMWGVVGGRREL